MFMFMALRMRRKRERKNESEAERLKERKTEADCLRMWAAWCKSQIFLLVRSPKLPPESQAAQAQQADEHFERENAALTYNTPSWEE
jgi:hypothetical protein